MIFMGLPPVLPEHFRVGPEPGVEPVRDLLVIMQIIGEQAQHLLIAAEFLAG